MGLEVNAEKYPPLEPGHPPASGGHPLAMQPMGREGPPSGGKAWIPGHIRSPATQPRPLSWGVTVEPTP